MPAIQRIIIGFLAVFFLITIAKANTVENQLQTYLNQHQAAEIQFLKRLVDINSGTMNVAGVYRVGKIVEQAFQQLGFETEWAYEPKHMHRAATLIAKHNGIYQPSLLLIGHLDTVFPPNTHFSKMVVSQDHLTASGPGVIDDKGGVVTILYALKALQASHLLKPMTITVVLTGDEEDSGKPTAISRKPLMRLAKSNDIALDFEPATSLEAAAIARRGICDWRLEVQGKAAHSASIFSKEVGAGAIFELARILNHMRMQLSGIAHVAFNPGLILAGTTTNYHPNSFSGNAFGKQNVVAKTALATGDLRFIDDEQKLFIQKSMIEIIKQHLPGTKATYFFQDGIPAMPPTTNNKMLLAKYSKVSQQLGFGVVSALDADSRGAGDISFVASKVNAGLVGLGPTGWGEHTVSETIELKSLYVQTLRAASLIYQLQQP